MLHETMTKKHLKLENTRQTVQRRLELQHCFRPLLPALLLAVLGLAAGMSRGLADVTIYQDLFNDQQNISKGGTYTQTLAGSTPTVRNGIAGGSASAIWTSAAETGGWGQRDYNNNGVATPTSSNYLPFTPQPGHLYLLTATINAANWSTVNGDWFTIGFTSLPNNWVPGNYVANLSDGNPNAGLVRSGSAKTIQLTLDTRSPGWANTSNLAYVGWIAVAPGTANLNPLVAPQVTIDNFSLVIQLPCTNTYAANGATGGAVPVDGSVYSSNATATVLGNTGGLTKTGYRFSSWNTAANGSGTSYSAGSTFVIQSNTTLFAQWIPSTGNVVTYGGNGNTGGIPPFDTIDYPSNATVTVLGNTGGLTNSGYWFSGWNTSANGSGANYSPGSTFVITSNTVLYAKWSVPYYPPGTLADYNEVWTTPSSNSWESMPLGNGETTLNVWVENNGDLRFYMGRSDAESEGNINLKLGRVRVKLTPNPFAAGQPFNQTLDLATGWILITAGAPGSQTRLQLWVDANHPVIRVGGDSDAPVSVEASYEMDLRTLNTATAIADAQQGDYVLNDGANAVTWYHRNRASAFYNNLSSEGLYQSLATIQDPIMNRTFGGRMSGNGLVRSGTQKLASSVAATNIDLAIDVNAGVYPTATNWLADLNALAAARGSRSLSADLSAHQTWWSNFWPRSYLNLGGATETRLIAKYYAHQRFINACTTRGNYPTPFNGSTLTMDRPVGYPSFFGISGTAQNADYRDWAVCRIFWQNTRHIYWPMLTSGDYDLTEQLSRFCRNILPICRERAMVWEGNPGMLMPEGVAVGGDSIFGRSIPTHLTEHRGGMTDMAILLADIYDHTRDQTFFTNTYQPWADAVVTFFEHKFPNRDAYGKILLAPSAAVETYKNSANSAPEVGPLRRILSDLLRLDPGTLTSTQRTRYQGMLDSMPEPPLKTVLNQPMLGVHQTGDAGRDMVETPSHYSVWPAREAGLGRPSLLAAGRRDHGSRMFTFDGTSGRSFESGGWLYTPTVAAQLNLPQQAKFYALRNFLDPIPETVGNGTATISDPYPGKPRFHAFWESRFDYIPDQCHGGSTIHGLENMVVQSQGNKIYLLPAWPEDWDLNFKVYAAQNTVLEGVYSNGVLRSLTVTPSSRAADMIDMSSVTNRIRTLVGVMTTDINYLLGLPPMRDGSPTLSAASNSVVTGPWLAQHGNSLAGGVAGPFTSADWGGSMAKGNSIYVHVLNWPGETLVLPNLALGRQVTNSQVLTGGSATVTQSVNGITITVPAANHDPIDTIIRLDLNGSAEALAWYQPYVGSLCTGAAASASAQLAGFEATNACDANAATSWRHGAASGTLTIPFGGTRTIGRIDVQFDNGSSFSNQNISVTLEAQSPSGAWSTLWSGTSYNLVLNRPLAPTQAAAVRLTTSAQGVRQLDVFAAPSAYTRTDNPTTSDTQIEVPADEALFQENLAGVHDLLKTGDGTLSLIDPAGYVGATRILAGTLKLLPPLSNPVSGFVRRFDASKLGLAQGASVTQWTDLSSNQAIATPQTGFSPTYVTNAVNGLGAIHFNAGASANTSQSLNFTRASGLFSMFSVFKGASFLLTDTSANDFHRPDDTNTAAPIWAPASYGWTSANILNGRTYVNGAQVDGSSYAMPTNLNNGFNQITVMTAGGVQADGFNRDRVYHSGDQTHGEVVLYTRTLTEAERLGTERYLRTKWFGEPGVSNILPTNTAVSLENNNCIFDLNGATQTIASLGSAPGSVVAFNGGTLIVAGNQGSAIVQGTITGPGNLVNQGTLRLVGDATLSFVGSFTNTGVLDIMTWNGALPAGFVNQGVVLDRSQVVIRSLANTNGQWSVSIDGYTGHNYQLQRSDNLGGGWVNIGVAQAGGSGGLLQLTDSQNPAATSGFYRVLVSP